MKPHQLRGGSVSTDPIDEAAKRLMLFEHAIGAAFDALQLLADGADPVALLVQIVAQESEALRLQSLPLEQVPEAKRLEVVAALMPRGEG